MDDARIGRLLVVLRQRKAWRQRDLAQRSGLSKSAICDMERGRMSRYTLASVRKVMAALGVGAEVFVVGAGHGEFERLLDGDHARLVEAWAGLHRAADWDVWPEASYSIYGERGRVDLLAFHPATGTLEVAECKTGIWNIQDTGGRLDAKLRLAKAIAAPRGWNVNRVIGALVVMEGRTSRRRIEEHPVLFARYDTRGRAATAFVKDPRRPATGLLAFVPLSKSNHGGLRRAGQQRVRRRAAPIRCDGPPEPS